MGGSLLGGQDSERDAAGAREEEEQDKISCEWFFEKNLSERKSQDGRGFPQAGRASSQDLSEQPCQPLENHIHPYLFTQLDNKLGYVGFQTYLY